MLSCSRCLKAGYLLALTAALVLLLSKPAPIQAQRTLAYPFLPGQLAFVVARGALAGNATPLTSYTQANTMLLQAGSPLDPFGVGMSGGVINGVLGGGAGAAGMGGGGFGGGGLGGGMGGMMGMGGGMRGGMGGMGGGGMGGMGGGMNMGGMGGMGGFAGKGFGGFNGKKPL